MRVHDDLYPVTAGPGDDDPDHRMRPGQLHFLRRMKEDLRDHDGTPLFKPRFAETLPVQLRPEELVAYNAVVDYVDTWYDDRATLARSIYGKRAASSTAAAIATLRRNGTPEDIAKAVSFILSDEADFVNGAMLAIDGGIIAAG